MLKLTQHKNERGTCPRMASKFVNHSIFLLIILKNSGSLGRMGHRVILKGCLGGTSVLSSYGTTDRKIRSVDFQKV